MEALVKRLVALRPTLEEIMSVTGTAGATYGVIYRGEVIYTDNIGFRDVENQLPIDGDTIFQVASLSKAMVAAGLGMLVDEEKLAWNTPLKEVLPEWHVEDATVRESVTLTDCLAHRTGLQMNNYWLASDNNIIISAADSMRLLNALKPVLPFRGQFQYNNLGYEVAGHVLEKLSGQPWGEMLRTRLFEPLGLKRTGTRQGFAGPDNVSRSYGTLSNGRPTRIGDAQIGDNTTAGAAGGVRSTLNDMLTVAKAYLTTSTDQFQSGRTSTAGSPLKQMASIMSGHIPTSPLSYHETSYGLGWARTQLPGPMGVIGLNGFWFKDSPGKETGFPIVAKSGTPELVIYHQGSNPGVLAALNLLPESQSAVVLLSNTLALIDSADFMGQALLETILDVKDSNDYLQITKDAVGRALSWYAPTAKVLREDAEPHFRRGPEAYIGVYWNSARTVHIDIIHEEGQLKLVFQGLVNEKWPLYPWKGDTLTWLPESRDALAKRGRFTFQSPDYYKIKFAFPNNGQAHVLNWIHEGWNVPEGEDFYKT